MDKIWAKNKDIGKYRGLFFYIFFTFFISNVFISNTNASNDESVLLDYQIQSVVDRERVKYHVPALSVSILLPNEPSTRNYVSGYLSLSKNKKVTSDTLFKVGSITKTFTAMIIMKLTDEKKLNLNDNLSKWFPQYPRWKEITVKNLLNHTSGIYNYTFNDNDAWKELKKNPNKTWKMIELVDLAYRYPDNFHPGDAVKYSNTDYVLLGLIIEKITHQPVKQVFDQYFKELNLKNTYLLTHGYSKKILDKMAHGYDNEDTLGIHKDVTEFNTALGLTDGAIISTPNDITNWLYQFFMGRIVSNKSLDVMMSLISPDNAKPLTQKICLIKEELSKKHWKEIGLGLGMGLVYFRDYGFAWTHSGGIPGYESLYTYNPCKGIYVVLTYDVKPKQQFIFINIAEDLFKVIDQSNLVKQHVDSFKQKHTLPNFCEFMLGLYSLGKSSSSD